MTDKQEPIKRLGVYLPESTARKAKVIAAQLDVSVSHLIEGLIEGCIITDLVKRGNHDNA